MGQSRVGGRGREPGCGNLPHKAESSARGQFVELVRDAPLPTPVGFALGSGRALVGDERLAEHVLCARLLARDFAIVRQSQPVIEPAGLAHQALQHTDGVVAATAALQGFGVFERAEYRYAAGSNREVLRPDSRRPAKAGR